jgi:hypothetical protein
MTFQLVSGFYFCFYKLVWFVIDSLVGCLVIHVFPVRVKQTACLESTVVTTAIGTLHKSKPHNIRVDLQGNMCARQFPQNVFYPGEEKLQFSPSNGIITLQNTHYPTVKWTEKLKTAFSRTSSPFHGPQLTLWARPTILAPTDSNVNKI